MFFSPLSSLFTWPTLQTFDFTKHGIPSDPDRDQDRPPGFAVVWLQRGKMRVYQAKVPFVGSLGTPHSATIPKAASGIRANLGS